MEPEWERSTRVCSSIDLQTDLLEALRAHAEIMELGPVEAHALVCFETVSRRTKRAGLMLRMSGAGHETVTQAVIVTPTRLVWAQRPDDGPSSAHSQLPARLDLTDYEKAPGAQLIPDHGLQIHGIEAMGGTVGTLLMGLGEGTDADHARHVFKEAVRAAHGEGPAGDPAATG